MTDDRRGRHCIAQAPLAEDFALIALDQQAHFYPLDF